MTTVTGVVLDSVGRPIQGSQVQIVLVTGSSAPGYAPSGEIVSPAELYGGTGAGSLHAIRMGQWCVESCSYHLVVWGAGASGIGPYVTGTLDTEGTVQVRGNLNNAGNLQGLMGELRLTGSPSAPTFTFATGLRLIKDTLVPGPAAGLTLTINVAAINTYYRPASITLSGGTVTTVKVSQLAGGASAPTMTTVYTQASGSLPSMTVRVGPGQWIEIDGTVIPSAQWTLD